MEFGKSVFVTCSLLFALAFFSTSGSRIVGQKWVVLIAGSDGWTNYRHQSDVCHAYQTFRRNGIPKENIITLMYDDIAYNKENPYPGKIFNNPNKIDVYENVIIDYRRKDVNLDVIRNVLLGNEKELVGIGSGKVLKSGPHDQVFIYYSDHGSIGLVTLPENNYMTYEHLLSILETMYKNKQYGELLFFMEACHSASMFENLPNNTNVFATTAANRDQNSKGIYCDFNKDSHGDPTLPCLGDQYTVVWLEMMDKINADKVDIGQQYRYIRGLTLESEVCRFGDFKMEQIPISRFFGNHEQGCDNDLVLHKRNHNTRSLVPSHEHDFHYLHKILHQLEVGSKEAQELIAKILSKLVGMKTMDEKMGSIVRSLFKSELDVYKIMKDPPVVERKYGKCFNRVLDTLMENCASDINDKGYILGHTEAVLNLCSNSNITEAMIIDAIYSTCSEMPSKKDST